MGESENDVEVRGREEFGLTFFKPSLPGDVLRIGDGVPHTDDPLVLIELAFKLVVGLFEVQVSTASGSSEVIDKLTTKDQGKGFLVEQVAILARDPAFALCAQGTTGYQAVQMKVGLELLIPGM